MEKNYNKKILEFVKNSYLDYKNNKSSKLKKIIKGGDELSVLPYNAILKDIYNVSELNYKRPYSAQPIQKIYDIPQSNFAY